MWNVIRAYDTTFRWKLYGEWKASTYGSHPELRIRRVQAERESKGILRRLSHNTIDTLSATVAKLAHSNPCVFYSNAVHQIMAYDNMAHVVIQALSYSTVMDFDVLLFVVMDAFANPNKDRLKDDGVNTSDWLQSTLSPFSMEKQRLTVLSRLGFIYGHAIPSLQSRSHTSAQVPRSSTISRANLRNCGSSGADMEDGRN